jgi:hypothetical protein
MRGHRICSVDDCDEKHYAHGWCHRHYQSNRASVQARTCAAPGCDEGHYAKGLCRLHWKRQRKSGDPRVDVPKRAWGQQGCAYPGCPEPHVGKGFCANHLKRFNRYGDPGKVQYAGWRGDAVGYGGLHERINRERGSATAHACQRCGRRAEEWAYDHSDPNEKQDAKRRVYSLDPMRYEPLCALCHRRADRKRRRHRQ